MERTSRPARRSETPADRFPFRSTREWNAWAGKVSGAAFHIASSLSGPVVPTIYSGEQVPVHIRAKLPEIVKHLKRLEKLLAKLDRT